MLSPCVLIPWFSCCILACSVMRCMLLRWILLQCNFFVLSPMSCITFCRIALFVFKFVFLASGPDLLYITFCRFGFFVLMCFCIASLGNLSSPPILASSVTRCTVLGTRANVMYSIESVFDFHLRQWLLTWRNFDNSECANFLGHYITLQISRQSFCSKVFIGGRSLLPICPA